jgi:DNA-directed RNA polymerase specialized sigma24 family protein
MMRELLPDDGLLDRERRNLAVEVVARLKKPCRELIALRIGRGLSYHQMSEVLGRTEAALRNQSYYCLKQARRILDRLRHRQQLVYLDRWRRG